MHRRLYQLAAALLVCVMFAGTAAALDRADCERDFKPQTGQSGKDVVWVPTGDDVVTGMLKMAKAGPNDLVIDLGAGDGKIAIAAAQQFGARAKGIEYNPDMVKLATCYAEVAGVSDRVQIVQGDIFETNFKDATIITMYLLPDLNLKLRPQLLEMKPGTRIASHSFKMADWEADQQYGDGFGQAFLWIVPAKVDGRWMFQKVGGGGRFVVDLRQAFQKITGTVSVNGRSQPLQKATLNGADIELQFKDGDGALLTLTGSVNGTSIDASSSNGNDRARYRGTRS